MQKSDQDISVGCDIEQIIRFVDKINNDIFLQKIFTTNEINYCKSKSKPEEHLAARFSAKEAVVKSLSDFKITGIFYKDIEVINTSSGKPEIKILKPIDQNIRIKISLSHNDSMAIAMVVAYKFN